MVPASSCLTAGRSTDCPFSQSPASTNLCRNELAARHVITIDGGVGHFVVQDVRRIGYDRRPGQRPPKRHAVVAHAERCVVRWELASCSGDSYGEPPNATMPRVVGAIFAIARHIGIPAAPSHAP